MEVLSKNKIKLIRSLKMKKNREKEGLFVVEGKKIVSEFIDLYPNQIEFVAGTSQEVIFERQFFADELILKDLSSFKTPSSLLAVVRKPHFKTENTGIRIALDGIQDPGNLGTIIRTADWFGVSDIICSKETVDCFNSKVIQSSMGSIFRVNVCYVDLVNYLEQENQEVFIATMEGENYQTIHFPKNAIILFGNEGNGVSTEVLNVEAQKITILRKGKAESLNVAVATGIILSNLH